MKTVKQAILDKILYIGEEIPENFVTDKRPKFLVLGSPQELIDETINDKTLEEIQIAFGEVSALFMSQDVKGREIIMPTEELLRIANELKDKLEV